MAADSMGWRLKHSETYDARATLLDSKIATEQECQPDLFLGHVAISQKVRGAKILISTLYIVHVKAQAIQYMSICG